MKRLIGIFSLIMVSSLFFSSCEKETLGLSKLTTFPTISIIGEKYIAIHVDDVYTDEGAEALVGTTPNPYTVSGEVDPSTPGIYRLDYTTFNADGFSVAAQRYVLVSDVSDDVDISGNYLRTGTSAIAKVTKIERGMFINDNLGGSTKITALMVMLDATTLEVPLQYAGSFGEVDALNEAITIALPDITFSYNVKAAGFGTQTRTFVRQ